MKTNIFIVLLISLVTIAICSVMLAGCGSNATGGGGGGGSAARAYAGTRAPGDVWSWTIGAGIFLGSQETGINEGFWISGTWETLSSKFGKMYISDSSTSDAVGKYAYFIEYKDTALIVIPTGESSNPIVCAALATTHPTTPGNYVTIRVPGVSWYTSSDTAYETTEVTWSGNLANIDVTAYFWNDHYEGNGLDQCPFSNGRLISAHASETVLTPSGMFIVDFGPGAGGCIGASVETFSSIEAASHSYRGLSLRYFPNGVNVTSEVRYFALESNPSAQGTLKGRMYINNPESGYDPTMEAIFSFGTQEPTGIISTEVVQGSDPTNEVKSVFAKVGTGANQKNIWFGFNVNGSDLPETILFIQTD